VVEVMKEKGIDLSTNKPKLITAKMAMESDLIVAIGCNDQRFCPIKFFKPTIEWKLEGPKGKSIEKVRKTRHDFERRVQELISKCEFVYKDYIDHVFITQTLLLYG
jgi:arsenate reductase (thioredoxin)